MYNFPAWNEEYSSSDKRHAERVCYFKEQLLRQGCIKAL